MLNFLLILMLHISPATQSDKLFVASDSLFDKNGVINLSSRNGWRFHPGDDMTWADPNFDDSGWMLYKPYPLYDPIPDSLWQGYGWFRFRFAADSSVLSKASHLYFYTWGAAEVYLDGKLVQKFGAFSTNLQNEKRYYPLYKTYPAEVLQPGKSYLLAVRYSYHKSQQYHKLLGKYARTFGFEIGLATDHLNQQTSFYINNRLRNFYILGTMFAMIVLLHLSLFMLFPSERSNLYIAILATLFFLHVIVSYGDLLFKPDILQYVLFIRIPFIVLMLAALSLLPFTINYMFNQKPCLINRILIALFPGFALANFMLSGPYTFNIIISGIVGSGILYFSTRVLIQARKNKQKGVWIVAVSFLCLILSGVMWVFYLKFSQNPNYEILRVLTYLVYSSVPLGLTAFMASRFRDLYTNLEQKVKERTRELHQSLEDLRSTQTQLIHSEKMASLGMLTAGIAHEIQNPLNYVNNFSEVNRELIGELKGERKKEKGDRNEETEDEILDHIEQNLLKINQHGKRADAIVKGMLEHSRAHSGQKEITDINALADKYLRLSYHGMRAKDPGFSAEFKTDFDINLPKINVVPQEIGRVLLNLFNNAFYAAPLPPTVGGGYKETGYKHEPMVLVSTKKEGNRVVIKVKDNGPGIPAHLLDKIFQPFFTTKPAGQGTGLGLSLAWDIVKAHGGEIKVETKEGEGSEFIVILPV
jgi:two-component system, NtrC family, sensor kinase